ncbi:GYDIA family GHMP kinase [Flavobacterium faecale]|uniref:GYDIA family GHMP kinase n=1 Tax=Flavobacterium faecale TaxID=1355330 RepID=UPI003AADA39B
MKKTFYSNGKLLITGEYLVLDGAKAFALPTKLGQNLTIEDGKNQEIQWKSYDADGTVWFEDTITFTEITHFAVQESDSIRNTLIRILHHAYLQNPDFIHTSVGYQVHTQLTFSRKWGLGTSSTLINNIAQWLRIDAFELLNSSFGGSGYDIACAQNDSAIIYKLENGKPLVEPINFNPEYTNQIYFVYLNRKQSSKTAIANYNNNKNQNLENSISKINSITEEIIYATSVDYFRNTLERHETKMSHLLETCTVKELLFPDFKGTVKSLGAWGGDFVMVVSDKNPADYFFEKGFSVLFPYEELILT